METNTKVATAVVPLLLLGGVVVALLWWTTLYVVGIPGESRESVGWWLGSFAAVQGFALLSVVGLVRCLGRERQAELGAAVAGAVGFLMGTFLYYFTPVVGAPVLMIVGLFAIGRANSVLVSRTGVSMHG